MVRLSSSVSWAFSAVVVALASVGVRDGGGGVRRAVGGRLRHQRDRLRARDRRPRPHLPGWDVYARGAADRAGGETDHHQRSARPGVSGRQRQVSAVAADGAGGWFIGGAFTAVGGVARNRLAHVHADGTLDADLEPRRRRRRSALAVSGGDVYAGGGFTRSAAQTRNRLAKILGRRRRARPTRLEPERRQQRPRAGGLGRRRLRRRRLRRDRRTVAQPDREAPGRRDGTANAIWNPNANGSVSRWRSRAATSTPAAISRRSAARRATGSRSSPPTGDGHGRPDLEPERRQRRLRAGGLGRRRLRRRRLHDDRRPAAQPDREALDGRDGTADATWNPNANDIVARARGVRRRRLRRRRLHDDRRAAAQPHREALGHRTGTADADLEPQRQRQRVSAGGVGRRRLRRRRLHHDRRPGAQPHRDARRRDGHRRPAWNPNANDSGVARWRCRAATSTPAATSRRSAARRATGSRSCDDAAAGTADATWNPNADGDVSALAVSGATSTPAAASPRSAGRRATGSRSCRRPATAPPTRPGTPTPTAPSARWRCRAATSTPAASSPTIGGAAAQPDREALDGRRRHGRRDLEPQRRTAPSTRWRSRAATSTPAGSFSTIGGQTRNRIATLRPAARARPTRPGTRTPTAPSMRWRCRAATSTPAATSRRSAARRATGSRSCRRRGRRGGRDLEPQRQQQRLGAGGVGCAVGCRRPVHNGGYAVDAGCGAVQRACGARRGG